DLQPKVMADGSVGFYSANPMYYGNITYGSDHDRYLVEQARKAAPKDYLMFMMPAPTVKQTGNDSHPVKAQFFLDGDNSLQLRVSGLAHASYPLSIDPTFLVSSTQDWVLGSVDDNIDLSVANQVGRAPLTGGSLTSWTTSTHTINGTTGNFAFGLTAYNGFLYAMGGGNTASTTVQYAQINLSTGDLTANFANTSSFTTARVGAFATGYNGYIYIIGGEDSTGSTHYAAVEYAKINSD